MTGKKEVTVSAPGVGFVGLLTLVFIVLKLTGVIAWSWWWVLSPLWISFGLWIALMLIVLALGTVFVLGDFRKRR